MFRDGFYLLAIEGLLIWMLGQPFFTPLMVIMLLVAYSAYAIHVMYDSKMAGEKTEPYNGKLKSGYKAWTYLGISIAALGFLCHYLALGIENIATYFNCSVYIVAVVLGAAATSLPDTILSVKSAKDGEYEDAVGNAIGSNIFDVTVALALPMLVAMTISGWNPLPIEQSTGLVGLRIFVWFSSAAVIALLLACGKKINKYVSYALFIIYGIWITYLTF